ATNTAYNINSDYRLKNVTGNADPAEALARIMRVSIREFTWKLDGRKDRGVIAHELAESHPNAVTGEKDAMVDMPGYPDSILPQSVDYSKLVPDLVAAIQAQQKTIEHLESQLVRLNANHGAG
ncbi:MAG: tail fiber domain-containing protein, partial [Achromobacter mucicolens]